MRRRASSRRHYREFVQKYTARELDDGEESAAAKPPRPGHARRREYLREYLRWLWPHRYAIAAVFVLALVAAGLEMIEPLFMRFIIDRVLLNTELDTAARLTRLHLAGAVVRRRRSSSPT